MQQLLKRNYTTSRKIRISGYVDNLINGKESGEVLPGRAVEVLKHMGGENKVLQST